MTLPTAASTKAVTACLIVIGNEVLSGRTRDANLQYLAQALNSIGICMAEARVIPDDETTIIAAVNECRRRFDYVLTTGGIGPTHDDITAASIAKAFGVPLIRDPQAEAWLRQYYRPGDVNPQRLKMADVPEGATLIENPVSKAPGFQIGNVIVLPGIPRIMQAMFEGHRHRLQGGAEVLSQAVAAFLPEGVMAGPLAQIQARYPDIEIGSYPFFRDGRLGAALVLRATDATRLAAGAEDVRAMIRGLGGEPIEDPDAGSPS
jgi:molybdenum cofactor synthesis domain-containing protein